VGQRVKQNADAAPLAPTPVVHRVDELEVPVCGLISFQKTSTWTFASAACERMSGKATSPSTSGASHLPNPAGACGLPSRP
jgi:hypothetical protein